MVDDGLRWRAGSTLSVMGDARPPKGEGQEWPLPLTLQRALGERGREGGNSEKIEEDNKKWSICAIRMRWGAMAMC